MSVVTLLDVTVLNNPAAFTDPYTFKITFEALENLQHDLEWKLTYVGSAQSSEHDQELDSLLVGPVPPGTNTFTFEADPPKITTIPSSEILGVTVILLTCSYDGREFVRVGYYVNNEYDDEALAENPPAKPIIEKIRRNILAEKPRVTRFAIKWDSEATAPPEYPPDQPEADQAPDDEAAYGAEEEEEEEEAEVEAEAAAVPAPGEDAEMGDADAPVKEDDEASDAGSEDLEAESSGSEEEDEEELVEGDVDEEMEVEEDKPASGASAVKDDVMVH
ncbi:histone deposition protein Asf1 [Trichodelitschia bisporula]|uniref:Histone chaperone n=1 Tax=Trichodelitschia bisporula TaxID=703511 RepID=A0A6G1HV97_9PEZI|nr:histone deposition protein Asf1 [Trichodelitschia bisporula]